MITAAGTVAATALGANAAAGDGDVPDQSEALVHNVVARGLPKDDVLAKFQERAKADAANCFDLTWGPLVSGDCDMKDLTLHLCSDGTAHFTSQVKTRHTVFGDVWHIHFTLRDRNNNVLFTSRTFDSATMHDNVFRPFNGDFTFPQFIFAFVVTAFSHNSC